MQGLSQSIPNRYTAPTGGSKAGEGRGNHSPPKHPTFRRYPKKHYFRHFSRAAPTTPQGLAYIRQCHTANLTTIKQTQQHAKQTQLSPFRHSVKSHAPATLLAPNPVCSDAAFTPGRAAQLLVLPSRPQVTRPGTQQHTCSLTQLPRGGTNRCCGRQALHSPPCVFQLPARNGDGHTRRH